jgi:hypothetical protein
MLKKEKKKKTKKKKRSAEPDRRKTRNKFFQTQSFCLLLLVSFSETPWLFPIFPKDNLDLFIFWWGSETHRRAQEMKRKENGR